MTPQKLKLARDYGLPCGKLPTGTLNAITDIPGVRVGHYTLNTGNLRTGVTAIVPHAGNLFREKVPAAVAVFNGFGKSVGLMQVEELGTLETPILLTNTLSVPVCTTALVRRAIAANPDIGRTTSTVNAVVCECNDGGLSDIQALAITEAHANAALDAAAEGAFEQGAVGAGTGMRCFGFKGGVGTASRRIHLENMDYHLGVLVLSNFGVKGDLILPDGRRPAPPSSGSDRERGSIIIILATDIPLDNRQISRVTRRCGTGLARLGAFWGHGSGDIAVGFSTGTRVLHNETRDLVCTWMLNEDRIDTLFRAANEATEEAVINSMLAAETTTGRNGRRAISLRDVLGD